MNEQPGAPPPASHAAERFAECRWSQPAEEGVAEHCTHRDVLPLAGAHGFTPEAWCLDCPHFKQKRKRRAPPPPPPPLHLPYRW